MKTLMSRYSKTMIAIFCCFLWGTAIPVLKTLYGLLEIEPDDVYNKLTLAGVRFLISGFLIGGFLLIRDRKVQIAKGRQWLDILIFGLLNTTLLYFFFYVGIGNTPAVKAVLIETSKPLMVVVLAHLFFHDDKITRKKITGLVLGTLGILIANISSLSGGLSLELTMTGEGFLLLSSVAYSFAVVYGKVATKRISSTLLNMHQLIVGSIILLIAGFIGAGGFHLEFDLLSSVLLLYSAALSATAFVLWYHLISKYSASEINIYFFLVPVFGSIISASVFPDEHLTIFVLISLLLMSTGIYLVNKK